MTPDGVGVTPPVDPAAETAPLSSLSGARYFDGTVTIVGAALAPDVSSFWSQQPIWTNNPLLLTGSNGNDVTSADQPELFQFDATHLVVTDANSGTWFSYDSSTGAYTQQYASDSTLSYSSSTHEITFTDSLGDTETFYGFSNSLPAVQHGQMADFTNSGGEELVYSYNTSGANVGRVATVTLKQDSTTIRQAVYTYYQGTHTGDDTYGNLGDLKLVQINDAAGHLIDQTYYRYYTSSSSTSYVGGLQYMFSLDSYLRLQAAFSGSDIDTLTASQIQNYADVALQYDPTSHDVTQVISQGLGCSACDAGLGTYDYSYAVNADCDNGFNTWKYETTETQPDGSANIVFANYQGETLFTVHADSVAHAAGSSSAPKWMTFDYYDSNGRLIDVAEPSAVSGYSLTGDTLSVSLDTGSGLVEQTDYYTSSGAISANNATSLGSGSNIGGINGYVEDYGVKQGWSGTEVLKEAFQYYLDTPAGSGTALVAPLATDTVYAATGGGSPETATYTYTLSSTDTAITSETVTLPSTTADEASGAGDSTTTTFDVFGRPVWTQDAAGYLSYTQYDPATGAVVLSVQDVNTSTGIPSGSLEASTKPSGWTTPTGGGLNLVTTDIVDPLGRSTEETDPSMRATFTIYNDALHEIRTYAGWTDNGIVSGHESYTQQTDPLAVSPVEQPPTEVEIDDLTFTTTVGSITYGNTYSETFTMSAAAATDGTTGAPTGGETIADIQSLSVSAHEHRGPGRRTARLFRSAQLQRRHFRHIRFQHAGRDRRRRRLGQVGRHGQLLRHRVSIRSFGRPRQNRQPRRHDRPHRVRHARPRGQHLGRHGRHADQRLFVAIESIRHEHGGTHRHDLRQRRRRRFQRHRPTQLSGWRELLERPRHGDVLRLAGPIGRDEIGHPAQLRHLGESLRRRHGNRHDEPPAGRRYARTASARFA